MRKFKHWYKLCPQCQVYGEITEDTVGLCKSCYMKYALRLVDDRRKEYDQRVEVWIQSLQQKIS